MANSELEKIFGRPVRTRLVEGGIGDEERRAQDAREAKESQDEAKKAREAKEEDKKDKDA